MQLCLVKSLSGKLCTNETGHLTDHECWSAGKLVENWPNGRPNDVEELFRKWAPVVVHKSAELGKDVLQVVEAETGIPVSQHVKTAQEEAKKAGQHIVKVILEHTADNIGKKKGD